MAAYAAYELLDAVRVETVRCVVHVHERERPVLRAARAQPPVEIAQLTRPLDPPRLVRVSISISISIRIRISISISICIRSSTSNGNATSLLCQEVTAALEQAGRGRHLLDAR